MGHVSPLQYDHIGYHVQQKIVIIMSTFIEIYHLKSKHLLLGAFTSDVHGFGEVVFQKYQLIILKLSNL